MDLQPAGGTAYEFDRSFPTSETTRRVFDDQDLRRAVEAYRFFYPTVSMEAIFHGNREVGIEDGKGLLVMATGPRHVIFTANSDTPYSAGTLDLRAMGPVVIDLPQGPYIGAVDDHNHRWILDMGLPGPDAGRGGKHLVLPPDHRADLPAGHQARRSPTYKAIYAMRALPAQGDVAGALRALRQVKVHPLGKPDAALPFVDVTERAIDLTPLRWEDNLEYWRRLHAVIDEEPVLDEFRAMNGLLAALGIAKGKRFAPDERSRRILEAAARIGLDQLRVEAFANGRPDCRVWPDRRWEWVGLVPGDPQFETASYLDLQARDRWFAQAIATSPAMFRRQVGSGSVYFLAARDRSGAYLDGGRTYELTVPQPVPAALFWSVTAYDAATRSQVRAPRDRAVLGSLLDHLEPGADGSVKLHFGPDAPAGRESPWIQTSPGRGFFLYFRIYGPEAASLDGTWKPGDLTPVDA